MRVLLPLIAILISGCVSTQSVANRIADQYGGQNFDQFVRNHGIPHSKYQMGNGGYIYVWNSGIVSVTMPATTSMSGTVSSTGYVYGTGTTTGGGALNLYCEVQIETDKYNTIRTVTITADTWGKWTTSRCSELFK